VEKGKQSLLREVRAISKLAKFIYVRQPMPLGDGHAILCAKEVIGNEPFAIMFGDDVVDNKVPALKQLMDAHEKTNASILALERIPKNETHDYGIIKPLKSDGRLHLIGSMVEKPLAKDAPSNLGIIGKYVVTPDIIAALEKAKPSHGGEIRLIDGLIELGKSQPLYGLEIEGKRYDTGNKFGLITATIDYALKRKDLGPQLKKYLRTLDLK
jgi:UTP--glucose-1-phosphate uridylyltransferase